MKLTIGIDLGEAGNHTALAGVERVRLPEPVHGRKHRYVVRLLEEYDLGISYPQQIERIAATLRHPLLKGCKVAADYTGVGRPVVQLLHQQRCPVSLYPILITSGTTASWDEHSRGYHVPKRELVGSLQVLLQTGLLVWHPKLATAGKLSKQLAAFKVRITQSHNETYGAEGRDQDDCVLAVALACWLSEHVGDTRTQHISTGRGDANPAGSVVDSAPEGVFL